MGTEHRFSTLQQVKRRFFAMRNGIIADTLRKAGSPYSIIFGLNFPQLREIADEFSSAHNLKQLIDALWENRTTRESRLTAVLLSAPGSSPDTVEKIIAETDEPELADLVAKRLLSPKLRHDLGLIDRLADSPRDIERYMALRLAYSLVDDDLTRRKALEIARKEIARGSKLTSRLARQLEFDADW